MLSFSTRHDTCSCSNTHQALVDLYNFHHFDNLRYSEKKLDPRLLTHKKSGLTTVTLLFAATYGDVTAIKRCVLKF